MTNRFVKGVAKLCLNLLILVGLVLLIRYGYQLFTTHPEDPLKGSILLILGFVAWILIISLSKSRSRHYWLRYKGVRPGFRLTTFSVIAVLLVLTFAGVQPFAGYKDGLVGGCTTVLPEDESVPESTPIPITKTGFDKVTDGLTSPELVASYMEKNVSYDFEKYERFLDGEDWGWDTPEEVFDGKKTNCGGYARFALYCLLKNGYEYDNFGKNGDNAAVVLGCHNSNVPNYRDCHTVLLYTKSGLFYTVDLDRIRGSFETIGEAATASLSTWTVCYFYDMNLRITKTVERVVAERGLRIGLEIVELVNSIRRERGSSELVWDDKLCEHSLAHSQAMAEEERLFHTDMNLPYAENAWGGEGSKSWGAGTIVESWMGSKMHRTWLLCPNLRHVAVGIAYSNNGMYASWTFWRHETQLSDWWYQHSPNNPPEWWK